MNKRYLVLLALLACLTGCVPVDSLNPLYTDKDLAFDESLLGSWVGPDKGEEGGLEILAREKDGKKSYLLVMTDKDKDLNVFKKTVYHAWLVKLNEHLFLDVVQQSFEPQSTTYSLQVKSGKAGSTIQPALLKIGEAAYLEFQNGAPDGRVGARVRRAHWILKVVKKGKALQLDWADDEEFRRAVQAGTVKLPSVLLGEGKNQDVVITASTQELQKFVAQHADDKAFFNRKTEELHRTE
ncbi:MAG TPA: hypothetical protein VLA83_18080 [Candidatus Binatia bacterium]|nr:hypothetical protein [Candidatus Binatia bacterium]